MYVSLETPKQYTGPHTAETARHNKKISGLGQCFSDIPNIVFNIFVLMSKSYPQHQAESIMMQSVFRLSGNVK